MGRELINEVITDTSDHYSVWLPTKGENPSTFFVDNKEDEEVILTIEGARWGDVEFYTKNNPDNIDGMGYVTLGSGTISPNSKSYETLTDRFDGIRVKVSFDVAPSGNDNLIVTLMR